MCARLALALAVLGSLPVLAQNAEIVFTFDNPQLLPSHYEITVAENGHCRYLSKFPGQDDFATEFDLTPAATQKIFGYARDTNYFSGDFDFTKHRIAFTGKRTLTYRNGSQQSSTTFNWSENKSIGALSQQLESISATLEAGQKLRDLLRHDKLGLNQQLSNMEKKAQGGWLKQLQLISPVLQQISTDGSVMDIARRRARNLLAMAQNTGER